MVQGWIEKIAALPVGGILVVPGGWIGVTNINTLLHLVEKTSAGVFSFVTCNAGPCSFCKPSPAHVTCGSRGEQKNSHVVCGRRHSLYHNRRSRAGSGLNYHPASAASAPKIRYRTCIRIDGVPAARMESIPFWTLLFTQWMKVCPSLLCHSSLTGCVLRSLPL